MNDESMDRTMSTSTEDDEYVPTDEEIRDEVGRLILAGYVDPDEPDYEVEDAALEVLGERRRRPAATYTEIFARSLLATVSLIDPGGFSPAVRAEYERHASAILHAREILDKVTASRD